MKKKRTRKKKRVLLLLISLGILIGTIALGWTLYNPLGPVNPLDQEEQLFTVKSGSSSTQIAHDLEQAGLLKNQRIFSIYARLSGDARKFKAGEYLLNPAMDALTIMEKLVQGKVATITFTVPEGYQLRQIAQVFAQKGIAEEEEFWELVKNGEFTQTFIQDIPQTENRLEGYLFPDTYTIAKGTPVKEVIAMMLERFAEVYKRLPPNNTGLSMHEVVTLASIVEGESVLDKERPIIASVFFNRLKIGQRLETDATLQYAFGERKTRVLYKDLEIDSPYNTYRHQGLPPGPIGSPGEASLRAVLKPEETKYYYFVARKDNSGEHVFARTLAEHNRNKRQLGY